MINFKRKKIARIEPRGFGRDTGRCTIHVTCSANNTHVCSLYCVGEDYKQLNTSSGRLGFKGTKRGTPYAAETTVGQIADYLRSRGIKSVDLILSGRGRGRYGVVNALTVGGRTLSSISDATPDIHNGCRPKKRRRV